MPVIDRINPEGDDILAKISKSLHNECFDEIVATGVDIHIERLHDGNYWMSIEKNGARQIVSFHTRQKALIIGRTYEE